MQNCAGPLQLHWSTVGRTHVINPKHQAPDGELNIEFEGRRPLPVVDRLSSSAKLSDPPWGLQGGSKSFGRCPSAALGLAWSTSAVRNCAGPLQLHWSTVGRTRVINPKHQAPTASPRKMCLFPLPPWRLLHGRNLLPKQARSQGGRVAVPSGAPSSI